MGTAAAKSSLHFICWKWWGYISRASNWEKSITVCGMEGSSISRYKRNVTLDYVLCSVPHTFSKMFPAIADSAFTTRSPNTSWYCNLDPSYVPEVWVPRFLKMNSSEHRRYVKHVPCQFLPLLQPGGYRKQSCICWDWGTWSSLPPPEVLLVSSGFAHVANLCFLLGFLVLLWYFIWQVWSAFPCLVYDKLLYT